MFKGLLSKLIDQYNLKMSKNQENDHFSHFS